MKTAAVAAGRAGSLQATVSDATAAVTETATVVTAAAAF